MMNRSLYVTWAALISKDIGLYSERGSVEEQEKEQKLVGDNKQIVIGPISLLTLAYLDSLELLSSYFEKIYVGRATVDEFDMEIMELSQREGEGYVREARSLPGFSFYTSSHEWE